MRKGSCLSSVIGTRAGTEVSQHDKGIKLEADASTDKRTFVTAPHPLRDRVLIFHG
jgi:hypothetical protein